MASGNQQRVNNLPPCTNWREVKKKPLVLMVKVIMVKCDAVCGILDLEIQSSLVLGYDTSGHFVALFNPL